MSIRTWILSAMVILGIAAFLIYGRITKIDSQHAHSYNPTREELHVPIIEPDMRRIYSVNTLVAADWESPRLDSITSMPFHVMKNVTPIDPLKSVQEKDIFTKAIIGSNQHYKLYITSTIQGGTRADREGMLTIENGSLSVSLNEDRIDSVAASWGLNYLVRGSVLNSD